MTVCVSIVIPVFNEEQAIGQVLRELRSRYPDYELVVVDDGSTDDTVREIDMDLCTLVTHTSNRGYGAALKTGARKASGDLLVFYDGDGQFDPNDVGRIVAEFHETGADIVIGARQSGSHSVFARRSGKLFMSLLANHLTKTRIPDLNCGLRAVRRDLYVKYMSLFPDGFSASTTSTLLSLHLKHQVVYLPVVVNKRLGSSSVRLLSDGFGTIMLIVRLTALFGPLRIFLPISIGLFAISFVYSVYDALVQGLGVPVLGAVLAIASLNVFLLGVVCDQVAALRLQQLENTSLGSKREK